MDNQQEQVLDSSREQKQNNIVHCTGPLYMQNVFVSILP